MMNLQTAASDKTKSTTATGFASLQIVTAACHGILNTHFTAPSPMPDPDWFTPLNRNLEVAKSLAREWIDDIAPQMTASVPGHVINYGTTYSALTAQIIDLLNKNPKAKGKDDPVIQQVFELVRALEEELGTTIHEVDETSKQLTEWGRKMQDAHDALYKGIGDIQKLATHLQTDIEKMNNAIKGLQAMAAADNTAVALSAGALALGLTIMVVGIAVAVATGGAATPIVVAVIAGLGAVGAGISWGVMQAKINEEFAEIERDRQRIKDDERRLIALSTLSISANSAVQSTAQATQALSDVKVMWSVFRGELQGTLDKLEKTNEELSMILNKAYILAAQKEWDLAVAYAQQLVGMQIPVESKTLRPSA